MTDFFENPYYRLNKILLSIIGQWPFQSVIEARLAFSTMIFFISTQVYIQVLKLSIRNILFQ